MPNFNSSEENSGKIAVVMALDVPRSMNLGINSITVNIPGPISDRLDMTFLQTASASVVSRTCSVPIQSESPLLMLLVRSLLSAMEKQK